MPQGELGTEGGKKREMPIASQAQRVARAGEGLCRFEQFDPTEKTYKQLQDAVNLEG